MAGGGNPPKTSSHKPSSSSSSHRKSQSESGKTNPSSDPKSAGSGDPKPPQPQSKPKPSNNFNRDNNQTPKSKPNPTPSPAHPNQPSDPAHSGAPFPFPDSQGPPPPPPYGFHMLERRTIILADGSVRSYFALPPDYQDFTPPPRPMLPHRPELQGPGMGLGFDRQFPPDGPIGPEFRDRDGPYMRSRNQDNPLGLEGRGVWPMPGPPENSLKRKFGDEGERGWREEREGRDGLERQRQQLLQYGNVGSNPNGYSLGSGERGNFMSGTSSLYMSRGEETRAAKYPRAGYENLQGNVGLRHDEVDRVDLKKAFFYFAKLVNENVNQKKNYLADGKQGPLQCAACGRSSKDFPDMHGLIMHTYNSDSADLRVDHLGLHKALCVLMGWSYSMPPDNSKTYQLLSADEAAANQDDLVMWPPVVIIHNTITGKGSDGRTEGLGNKVMDSKLRDLGFGAGKSKSLYGRDGHLGATLVKFAGDPSGLKEAVRLAEFFEKDNHGRKGWARIQSLTLGNDDENNPNLVKVDEKTGERKRIFYGYLGTVSDLDMVDFETRKKAVIESRREYNSSK